MVEDVEKLGAKLKVEALGQTRIFCHRKINIPKTGAVDGIAP